METNIPEPDDDFTLDLDATCAASAKRYKDGMEAIISHMRDFIEPYEETARACGEDQEAFWLLMKEEYGVNCTCDVIKKMAKALEDKISLKDLAFTVCYGTMKTRSKQLEGSAMAKKMLEIMKGLEGGTD